MHAIQEGTGWEVRLFHSFCYIRREREPGSKENVQDFYLTETVEFPHNVWLKMEIGMSVTKLINA